MAYYFSMEHDHQKAQAERYRRMFLNRSSTNDQYEQALNKISNEMDGNLEGLDAKRMLEEVKEIAEKALEDESI